MDASRFRQYVSARNRMIRVVSGEERECIEMAVEAALSMNLRPYTWTVTAGITPAWAQGEKPINETMHAATALTYARTKLDGPAMVILLDLADHLGEPATLRALRDVYELYAGGERGPSCIVMIDHKDAVPAVIGACSVRYEISAPGDEEIGDLIKETIQLHMRERPVQSCLIKWC
ncbi:MAG: hypothetical protein ACOVP8_01835 [Phycisphaerales bacterium]